jgi:hypothetical protein
MKPKVRPVIRLENQEIIREWQETGMIAPERQRLLRRTITGDEFKFKAIALGAPGEYQKPRPPPRRKPDEE